MEKKYLTISEFAGLRHVSIGSLRYYEKLQILTPARIDPENGYRYYLPEQLGTLDAILYCSALDIPLRELKDYTDENGVLDQKHILTRGKQVMQERIASMQEKLELTQFNLDRLDENQRYRDLRQVYTRQIGERFLIAQPLPGDWHGFSKGGDNLPMQLFREAQAKGMTPVFPAGILLRCTSRPAQAFFYFQVLHPDLTDPRTLTIPQGEYACLQADLVPKPDLERLLEEHFPDRQGKTILIYNMLLNKAHFDSLRSEIQMVIE